MTKIACCLALSAALLLGGCAMGRTVRRVSVLDENGRTLDAVIVVPLYSVSSGINIGPNGKQLTGQETSTLLVCSAARFSSGENLFEKEELSRGVLVPVPPFMFLGTGRFVRSRLIIKKHYAPGTWFQNDSHPRPIVLRPASGNECESAIDLLLQPHPDRPALKKLFQLEWLEGDVQVNLSAEARALLLAEK